MKFISTPSIHAAALGAVLLSLALLACHRTPAPPAQSTSRAAPLPATPPHDVCAFDGAFWGGSIGDAPPCDPMALPTTSDRSCPNGYTPSVFGCVDRDECAEGQHDCGQNAVCENLSGSYTCHCDAGYVGDGFGCRDLNECTDTRDACTPPARCINTDGWFLCQCPSGYETRAEACIDVDECERGAHDCVGRAVCQNTEGAYLCQCPPGYEAEAGEDGTDCAPLVHAVRTPSTNRTVGDDLSRTVGGIQWGAIGLRPSAGLCG